MIKNFVFALNLLVLIAFAVGLDDAYIDQLIDIENQNEANESWENEENFTRPTPKVLFQCPSFSRSFPNPSSVHALRPGDIDVVGAIGDSLTAANGAKARLILGLIEECRGYSWSMGGEKKIEEHASMPNILRQFNPSLYGFSVGSGRASSANAVFNTANPGDTSYKVYDQAKDLVNRIRNSQIVNFNQSWKLITLFIGGNDLCGYCEDKIKYNADNYIQNLRNTLDYLHEYLPRALINMVLTIDVTGIDILNGIVCRNMQKVFCNCALIPQNREYLSNLVASYHNKTEELIASGRYDTRDDFTVVVQPLMKYMRAPLLADGRPDYSYFAPDCFHFSIKGHQAAGVELWNNMLTPVGKKTEKWESLGQTILCPNYSSPFIFTNKNSQRTYF